MRTTDNETGRAGAIWQSLPVEISNVPDCLDSRSVFDRDGSLEPDHHWGEIDWERRRCSAGRRRFAGRGERTPIRRKFLASDEAGYVTGASLVADGGRTVVMQDDALPDYRERRK